MATFKVSSYLRQGYSWKNFRELFLGPNHKSNINVPKLLFVLLVKNLFIEIFL